MSPSRRTPSDPEKRLWDEVTQDVKPLSIKSVSAPALSSRSVRPHTISQVIDLHGMTIAEAYAAWLDFSHANYALRYPFVTVITGSGLIRAEFSRWTQADPRIRNTQESKGGGAFRVYYRKRPLGS